MRSEVFSFFHLVIHPKFPAMHARLRRGHAQLMRSPVGKRFRFLQDKLLVALVLISVVLVAVIAFRLGLVLAQPDRPDVIANLLAHNSTATERLVQTLTPADLDAPMRGEQYARFDAVVQSTLADPTARVRLWHQDGTILYANDGEHIADGFAMPAELLAAWQGKRGVKITLRTGQTDGQAGPPHALLATYTPVQLAGESQPRGVLEIQQTFVPTWVHNGELAGGGGKEDEVIKGRLGLMAVGIGLLYGGLALLVWRGRRTMRHLRTRLNRTNACLHASTALLREVHEHGPLQSSVTSTAD